MRVVLAALHLGTQGLNISKCWDLNPAQLWVRNVDATPVTWPKHKCDLVMRWGVMQQRTQSKGWRGRGESEIHLKAAWPKNYFRTLEKVAQVSISGHGQMWGSKMFFRSQFFLKPAAAEAAGSSFMSVAVRPLLRQLLPADWDGVFEKGFWSPSCNNNFPSWFCLFFSTKDVFISLGP